MEKVYTKNEQGTRTEPAEKRERKTRKDKGQVLLTQRDLAVLRWIGEQFGVQLDQLQQLLGRLSQHETQETGIVAAKTAERVVERWRRAGLAESQKIEHRRPAWVWLTVRGLRELGLPYKPWRPTLSTLEHYRRVNEVRLYVESRTQGESEWRGERRLKQEATRRAFAVGESLHYADAEVIIRGETIGIEVELTPKAKQTLLTILRGLLGEYSGIWYFTNDKTHGLVQRMIAELPREAQGRFKVYRLEQLR